MAEGQRHAQPLAAPATTVRTRHLGARPGLVDENQPRGLEVVLAVEPGAAPGEDVGAVLLGRVAGLFLRVIPCRLKKRERDEIDTVSPVSPSFSLGSVSAMSPASSKRARMRSRCASVTWDQRSPP